MGERDRGSRDSSYKRDRSRSPTRRRHSSPSNDSRRSRSVKSQSSHRHSEQRSRDLAHARDLLAKITETSDRDHVALIAIIREVIQRALMIAAQVEANLIKVEKKMTKTKTRKKKLCLYRILDERDSKRKSKKSKSKDKSRSKSKNKDKKKFYIKRKSKRRSSLSDDDSNPRSAITGKKLKLKIRKTADDKERDQNRSHLLDFLNSAF
ncbi:hypothetical protein J3Q64DRAFT_1694383 [Phycomyces blakesleeanus]|uniref:Uncharacterized protein n=2 Tax=Phycomyces blakesleeanus TaxID=4837 RepID=A0A167QK77_PHYB8|nr:hypothetical protein PHYBLDRAFT_58872 [Phycomyces blakesleeanus NRRL 1555(-)]OAD79827.1 hypothetical protein PHYBLDRAFT_58872 [Phycomyces blakesleeanus NRRL 1555(-)]|eukprot:XP_018297867.1 hypothetical protein PHYBLDRAFT_58872 [Phycomyces blakesleeanus NRRL 1555(-)]